MKEKKSCPLGGLIRTAALVSLFVPYQFEKTDEGFKVKSIIASVECRKIRTATETAEAPEDTDTVVSVSIPGILADQMNTVKELSSIAKDFLLRKKDEMKEKILEARKAAAEAASDVAEEVEEIAEEITEAVEEAAEEISEA